MLDLACGGSSHWAFFFVAMTSHCAGCRKCAVVQMSEFSAHIAGQEAAKGW